MAADLYANERRKPRIMVAGEFSAGKTRLINSLMGRDVLPSQVTSTSLPPIWLVYGAGDGVTVGVDGSVTPLDFDAIDVESTAYSILPLPAPLLEPLAIIDTPGHSDPNIPPSCWARMLGSADGLRWSTRAIQAWPRSDKPARNALTVDLPATARPMA